MLRTARPITVALIDDYDVVLKGLAHMFDDYRDRIVIAEIDAKSSLTDAVDVVMYDSFAQPESDQAELEALVANRRAGKVVVYTWNFHPELVASARATGVHGYLAKSLSAGELVRAIERIHAGEEVVTETVRRSGSAGGLDWPGKREGISNRESEILALITQGKSNAEIANLTYLSPNTIKSYVRSIYRKIGVASRTQAVIWGIDHGFAPNHHRIDHWLGGP